MIQYLKVWGGGIYELDEFYEIADELGILIWQVNCRNMIQGSRSWQPFDESKNVLKIYINIIVQAQNFAPSRNFSHPANIYDGVIFFRISCLPAPCIRQTRIHLQMLRRK